MKEKKPTIAILVNSLVRGGAERIALVSLRELQRKGFETVLICIEKEEGYKIPSDIRVIYLTSFNKLQNPFIKVPWIFISAFRLSKYVKEYQVDFIQSHLIRSNIISMAAKFFGARHRSQLVSHLPMNLGQSAPVIRFLKRSFFSRFYRKADEIVSISHLMKSEIEESLHLSRYGVRHRVIYNPHNLQKIRLLVREAPDLFNFPPDKRYILSVGRLLRHKRLEVTINALAIIREKYPDVELIVLGEGKERKFFEQVAEEKGLGPYVHFLGRTPNPFAYMARSDVFVLSSELEGLPNIIIESLACGTPVISSDCLSGPREILSPDSDFSVQITSEIEHAPYGILYPVGQVDLLAQGIELLLSDAELRNILTERGKQYVEKFDKEKITSEYIQPFFLKKKDRNIKDVSKVSF